MSKSITTTEELYKAFDGLSMEGGWHRKQPALWAKPRENFLPAIWKYDEVKPILAAAGKLISTEFAERRNLTMTNPVEGNIYPTVRTIVAAYQMIQPNETADAHRHTPNALRMILEGRGTYTVVDGARVEMRPGDVLLTPNWAWHSHENVGREDCYWLDFLDVPLVHLLENMFFEHHPDGVEASPVDVASSPIAFRWEDTLVRLREAPDDASGMSDREVELGAPALPTMGLYMQRFSPGRKTRTMQTTANSLFAVAQGTGRSIIGGKAFEWKFGDVFAVPAWRAYQHEATSDAVLLRVTDKPLFEKLGWLREDVD
jgi:gentisate 1,2-dioxygenase